MTERITRAWSSPGTADLYSLALDVQALKDGKSESNGEVTLAAGAATTTLNDRRLGGNSKVFLFPTTANAATEFGAGTLRAATPSNGACVITHVNNAQTDRTFWYQIVG